HTRRCRPLARPLASVCGCPQCRHGPARLVGSSVMAPASQNHTTTITVVLGHHLLVHSMHSVAAARFQDVPVGTFSLLGASVMWGTCFHRQTDVDGAGIGRV